LDFLKFINHSIFGGVRWPDVTFERKTSGRREEAEETVRHLRTQTERPKPNWDDFGLLIMRDDQIVGNVLREQGVTDEEYAAWKAAYEADEPQRNVRKAIFECERLEIYDDFPVLESYVDEHGLSALVENFGVDAEDFPVWRRYYKVEF
jgi:hypothetical protein